MRWVWMNGETAKEEKQSASAKTQTPGCPINKGGKEHLKVSKVSF